MFPQSLSLAVLYTMVVLLNISLVCHERHHAQDAHDTAYSYNLLFHL